ncbi:MAG: 1-acyl-sn-glycerol-3-phosphate acyltransferase [Oscillospiraceae bacterium]|nr:1-acyl-sn-glycerol-3-phosphate acyltransferase [Oscillospiraceae bacterium]
MFFKICYLIAKFVANVLYRTKYEGRENVPEHGCLVCANHSSWMDPIFVGVGIGVKPKISVMAKQELFEKKISKWFFTKLGAFPVRRGETDLTAIRKSYSVLGSGESLMIFPEGTRYDKNNAKSGAGMFALRTGCTVLPVYVSDEKKMFKRTRVVIGKPFVPEKPEGKLSHEHYAACSDEILSRIYALEPKDNH